MTIRELLKLFSPQRRRLVAASVLASLGMFFAVALLATSGWLISRASQQPPVLTLEIAVVGVRTFALGRAALRYSERLISHDATFRCLVKIRVDLYDKLEKLVPTRLNNVQNSDLITRLVLDVDELQNFPLRVLIPIISGMLSGLCAVILSATILPSAGITLAICLVAGALFSTFSAGFVVDASAEESAQERARLRSAIGDLIDGMADITNFNAIPLSFEKISNHESKMNRITYRHAKASGISNSVQSVFQGVCIVVTLVLSITAVNTHEIPGVMLAVVVFLPLGAFESIASFPTAMVAYQKLRGSSDRVQDILKFNDQVVDTETTNSEAPSTEISNRQLSSGIQSITLDCVSAGWDALQANIRDISCHLHSGAKFGIIGESGSGKSTIAAVLLKIVRPISGQYRINEIDAKGISTQELHNHFIGVNVNAHIFGTTLRENLALAWMQTERQPTDEELLSAVKFAALDDWFNNLPDGLNTNVGPNGSVMSAGQQQRLRLARIFLASPDVWVLDEPTEYLNTSLAERVMASIFSQTQTNTLILFTHQVRHAGRADHLAILECGQILETGSPQDLLEGNSKFSDLLQSERSALKKLRLTH